MKKIEFMQKMKELTDDGGWGTQHFFEKEFDGGCPCFKGMVEVDGKDLNVAGRCWRVSDNVQDLCVWGSQWNKKELRELAKPIKKALDAQEWYNKYTIILEEFN